MRRYMGMVGAAVVGPGPLHARSSEPGERAHPLCNYSFCATPEIWTREWGPTVEERFLGKKIGVEKGNGGRKDGGGERWIIARMELFHEQKTDPSLRVIG